ncbi:hypothetical protein V5799_010983 [Amblyomma americanum]|uniref:T-box domain-containing protein n=1 Tax=Amblyomma americanum TaxID=6943 RepID=A0AAQ4EJ68_AMBAM
MGASLHDAYHTGPWRLLPDDWDARSVKLYSTVFSRTYQSALAFLYSFLPKFSFDRLHLVPSRDINFCMGPHCACPQLKTYERLFTRKTKLMLKNHLAVVQLLGTLGEVLSPQGNNSEFVAPRPIMDGLMGFVCQRKPLPCADHHCATMEHVGNVISYVDWEGRQLSQDLSFRRSSILKAHYLLARIHRGLRDFMEAMKTESQDSDSRVRPLRSGLSSPVTTLAATAGPTPSFQPWLDPAPLQPLVFQAQVPCASLAGVQVTLENRPLWEKFYAAGNEMIITRPGRRMFPVLRVKVSHMESSTYYMLLVDLVPADNFRYRFLGNCWLPVETAESDSGAEPRLYLHEHGPCLGSQWELRPVDFGAIKLTNQSYNAQHQASSAALRSNTVRGGETRPQEQRNGARKQDSRRHMRVICCPVLFFFAPFFSS